MSKVIEDVKSGLKAIHGAGETLRGKALSAADQLDPHPNDPHSVAVQAENRAIIDKGNREMRGADESLASREWERRGVSRPADTTSGADAHASSAGTGLSSGPTAVNTQTAAAPASPVPEHSVAEGAIRENAPGSNIGNRLSRE